jgi:hypothetical protein
MRFVSFGCCRRCRCRCRFCLLTFIHSSQVNRENERKGIIPKDVNISVDQYYTSSHLELTDEELVKLFPDFEATLAEFMRDKPDFDPIAVEKLLSLNESKYAEIQASRIKGLFAWARAKADAKKQ